ncbi:hypothetical protein PTSG_13210 [Salpingoeca rosetta]|uniref:RNA-directed DNA polymerase n=1 Tax=Salpingoeca rosetta (strain ATCC 50818 / BSB-021) TaxID=946362 RepID=F2UTI7_SALR5|nr:uncharacterized protein PTSG_13210 [Salpingoeca rosetta]EGD83709.1 hypothetical protein PTSG_13210 [Salpingoeca rosetta]|eukprot:XP_004987517.1 hypothetical protein PTSG_13210 [Salpingoeca rosetta]
MSQRRSSPRLASSASSAPDASASSSSATSSSAYAALTPTVGPSSSSSAPSAPVDAGVQSLARSALTRITDHDPAAIVSWFQTFRTCTQLLRLPSGPDQIRLATLYFDGALQQWARHYIEANPDASFDEFETAATTHFADPSKQWRAFQDIVTHRQRGAVTGYIASFRRSLIDASPAKLVDLQIAAFVAGLRNDDTRRHLNIKRPSTLEEAYSIATDFEQTVSHNDIHRRSNNNNNNNNTAQRYRSSSKHNRHTQAHQRNGPSRSYNRNSNNNDSRHGRKQCTRCNRQGHVASDCFAKKTADGRPLVGRADIQRQSQLNVKPVFTVPAFIEDKAVKILIDTGAEHSFVSSRLDVSTKERSKAITFTFANGTSETTHRWTKLTLDLGATGSYLVDLPVSKCPPGIDVILGMDWITDVKPTFKFLNDRLTLGPPEHTDASPAPTAVTQSQHQHQQQQHQQQQQQQKQQQHQQQARIVTSTAVKRDNSTDVSGSASAFNDCAPISEIKVVNSAKIDTYLAQNGSEVFIGAIGSLVRDVSAEQKDQIPAQVRNLLQEFDDVFPEELPNRLPPSRPEDVDIVLKPNATPPPFVRYRLNAEERAALKSTIADLLNSGRIQPSKSAFAAPVIFVRKADKLNSSTIGDQYPLPDIEAILNRVAGNKYFTKLDLHSGYHQLRLKPEAAHRTAFACDAGHFEFRVLPFGLKNGPATFQRLMDRVIRDIPNTAVYLDDLIVFTRTLDDHVCTLRKLFSALRREKLACKPRKCVFAKPSLPFLGHVVSADGISPDPNKTKDIISTPKPTSMKSLRAFLGLAGYYRKFIHDFSTRAAPLYAIKEITDWTATAAAAFNDLKTALTSPTVLAAPDQQQRFVIRADASDVGIGAVLEQNQRPVAFMSRALTAAERNYPVRQKELLALLVALRKWRHLFGFQPVRIHTDHRSLLHLATQDKVSERRIHRWLDELAEYSLEWEYTPGPNNVIADSLSRMVNTSLTTIHPTPLDTDYGHDKAYRKILKRVRPPFTWKGPVLFFKQRRCITATDKLFLLRLAHDAHAHSGVAAVVGRLTQDYYWPRMYSDIRQYVTSCHTCLEAKSGAPPKAALHPLAPPDGPWSSVSMDFITGLPKSTDGFDAAFVFVDRFSKMTHIAPCHTTTDATDAARILLSTVVRLHGVPSQLVSDRDPRFTSRMFKELMAILGVRLSMSTAGHAATDGQTERMNQVIGNLLRCMCADHPETWTQALNIIEFTINSNVHGVTKTTPFSIVYGRTPQLHFTDATATTASAEEIKAQLQLLLKQTKDNLWHNTVVMANDGPQHEHNFKPGDNVYISTYLLRDDATRQQHGKLRRKYLGPFTVDQVLGPTHLKINLPARSRIHPVINTKFVRHVKGQVRGVDRPPALDTDIFAMEAILGHKMTPNGPLFLTKWLGYPSHDSTWEPAKNFIGKDAKRLLRQYRKKGRV